jgi:hypothetical protein
MNKNNAFVKFAHFYTANIKGFIDDVTEIWDEIQDMILPGLLKIFCNLLMIVFRVIFCILPVKQIIYVFKTGYLDVIVDGRKIHSDYYLKTDLEKLRKEIAEEEPFNDN